MKPLILFPGRALLFLSKTSSCSKHYPIAGKINKPFTKTPLLPGVVLRITLKLIIIFSLSTASYSQTFFGMSSSHVDNANGNAPTATVVPPALMQAGDLVVLYGQYRNNSTSLTIGNTGGQSWNSEPMFQGGTQSIFISWCRFNGTWAANPTVTGGAAGTPLSAVMYVYRPSVATNLWGINVAQTNSAVTSTAAQTINGVTTTLPNTVTMAFWSNSAATTWANSGGAPTNVGWTKPVFPALAGQIRNTQGSDQSHTAAYNIQALPATLNNAQQTQSAATNTLRSIMSWYEYAFNNEIATQVNLTPAASCAIISGTMNNATVSTGIPTYSCFTAGTFLFDVWYQFTATSSNHTITLSNYGSNFTRRQLVVYETNTLGTLSAVTCSPISTTGTSFTLNFTDYSPGTTYLIRVLYPNTVNTPIATNGGFRICVTRGTNNVVQPVLSGKSYTNITRPSGGTVQTGDVLEFRNSINVANWSVTNGSIYNTTFHDTIPSGLSYVANSVKFETNEGLQFESGITGLVNLTDASGDDEAVYSGGVLRVNVGSLPRQGASALTARQLVYQGSPAVTPITYASAGGGKIHARGRPSQFAQYVVIVVTYQATVTAATGTTFTTSNGQFRYKPATSSFDDVTFPQTIIDFPRYTVHVSEAGTSLCQGGAGTNVYSGGDFGTGTTRHDSTQLTIAPGYTWIPFATGAPQDGEFSVVNNTSANGSTNKYAAFPDVTTRVHQVWDIIGDHTGAAIPDSGNFAVPWGTNGGYMGVVNAAFGINTAIQKNITGLCTDTYYEFSAWFKNICAGCSTDSAGRAMGDGALFKPYLGTKTLNDSAGVSPDLTYTIDGVDYYTTGSILYDKRWVKKGFLFKTGPSQTAVNLTIRNNAPGGGGNDWAIDDIALTTCFPSMTYSPSSAPNICEGNILVITDTVRYLYNNYIRYKWQRWSAATSGPWTDIAGTDGTGTPVWNGTDYEYVASYTIPTSATTLANDGDMYRLVVASNVTNLAASSCSYSDPTTININILPACGPPLAADLLSVSGKLIVDKAKISWVTVKEQGQVKYSIERSNDGTTFTSIGMVNGNPNATTEKNYYNFDDPQPVIGKAYYRIAIIADQVIKKYSRTIVLSTDGKNEFGFGTVVNPFNSELRYEVNSPLSGLMKVDLIDGSGKIVITNYRQVLAGINSLSIYNTGSLARGMYIVRISFGENIIYKKVLKE